MTSKQKALHWNLWKQVIAAQGWQHLTRDQLHEKRHGIYLAAFGRERSFNDFNVRGDADTIFAWFKMLAEPGSVAAGVEAERQRHERKGDRDRCLFRIQQLAPNAGYLEAIMRDCFDTVRIDDLDLRQLEQLCTTLVQRKRHRDRLAARDALTA